MKRIAELTPRTKVICGAILVASLFLIQACASIITGTTQQVTFASEPEGATVTVSGRVLGKTPITVNLKKEKGQTLTFEKEGYKNVTMALTTTLNPWFWGNIVLGGLIGSTTDGISGTVHQYAPDQYMVTLAPTDEKQDMSRSEAKVFIVTSYKSIIEELNTTPGQYVSSMFNLLKVPDQERDQALEKITELSGQYEDIPTFANQVVKTFMKE